MRSRRTRGESASCLDGVWPALPPWSERTIPQMFENTVRQHPKRPAVVTNEREWTYEELAGEVQRAADALRQLNIGAGDRVGLWLPNSLEWIVSNLAIASVRAVCVPINIRLRAREVDHILRTSAPVALLTTESFLTNDLFAIAEALLESSALQSPRIRSARYPSLRTIVAVEGSRRWTTAYGDLLHGQDGRRSPQHDQSASATPVDEVVNVFWTSGSTGEPKGARTSHETLENVWNVSHVFGLSAEDRCLLACPLFYVAGYYWSMLAALTHGAAILPLQHFTPEEVFDAIETHRATTLFGVASWHLRLLQHSRFSNCDFSSVRVGYSGGAALPMHALERLYSRVGFERFFSVYGMTETSGITTITLPQDKLEAVAGTIGYPLPGFALKYVDPATGDAVLPGAIGELCVRGRLVMKGYEGLTKEQQEAHVTRDGWFKTGDLVTRAADGRHRFRGRIKDVIKVGGENVNSAEIESVLRSHPAVSEAAVFGVPDDFRGEVVGAVIATNCDLSEEGLRAYCRRELAPFKVPRYVLRLEALPITSTGKVAKAELRAKVLAYVESLRDRGVEADA